MSKVVKWILIYVGSSVVSFFLVHGLLNLIDGMFSQGTLRSDPSDLKTEIIPEDVFIPSDLSFEEIEKPAWRERDSHDVFVFQDKLWLTGGLQSEIFKDDSTPRYDLADYFNDIWVSDDGTNWQLVKANAEFPPLRSSPIVQFGDYLYLIGGWSPDLGYKVGIWRSSDGLSWEKVIQNPEWSQREGHQVIAYQDKLYLFGGVNYDLGETYNDTWVSEDAIKWIKVEDGPWSPRWDHATTVYKDKLYLTGGMNLDEIGFNDVWLYDSSGWHLVLEDAPWSQRQGHVLVSYKDLMWLIGGLNATTNKGIGDTWYSDDGINWVKTKVDNPGLALEDHAAVVFDDKIWILGGMDSNWVWQNRVWSSTIKN